MSVTRQYELVYIVSPEATEQEITDLHAQVEQTVAKFNGRIDKSENWGRRKFAYEIGRHKEGTYVLEVIDGPGELIKELERRLRVVDHVIRFLVVRVDEEIKVLTRRREKKTATQHRRRIARGLTPEPTAAERQRSGGGDDEGRGGDMRDMRDGAEG